MATQPMAPTQRLSLRALDVMTTPAALVAASYLAALGAAEVLLINAGLVAGSFAHAALLATLIGHYVAAPRVGYRRLLLAFALLPLIRMVGLTVPLSSTSPLIWILAAGTPSLLAAVLCARAIGAHPGTLLAWNGREAVTQLVVAFGGVMHGLLAFLVLRSAPLVAQLDLLGIGASVVVLAVFAGFTEELVFRGIIQTVASEALSSRTAGMIVSSAAFTLAYVGSLSLPFIILMLAVGLFFGWVVRESGSLWGVIGAHALMSIGLLVIWPLVLS